MAKSRESDAGCVHCGSGFSFRRGLCKTCYGKDGVRHQYLPMSTSRHGLGGGNHNSLKPTLPTACLPGTLEKMDVLSGRIERGEVLFHPRDARIPD